MDDSCRLTILSDEISQDPVRVGAFLREFGLGGFELRSMFGRAFRDLTDADVAEIRRLAAGEGWRIHGCATPVGKCGLGDNGAAREHGDLFRRGLAVARELGCPLLRVFTFWRGPTPLTVDRARRIADRLRPWCAEAGAAGMILGIENEASCEIATPAEAELLLECLPDPAAALIWDPCNVLYLPDPPPGGLADAFLRLAPRIAHVHVKDALRTSAPAAPATAVPVGEGQVDWAAQLGAIRRSGYDGRLALETHWRRTALDRQLLHLPAGHAFSAGGEEASRICFTRLRELWSGRSAA